MSRQKQPAEMTRAELEAMVYRAGGVAPPARRGASKEEWRAWFVSTILMIGLKNGMGRDGAVELTQEALRPYPAWLAWFNDQLSRDDLDSIFH